MVGLPLGAQGPELDHSRSRLGQGEQDLLPLGAGRRHLGLGREKQVGPRRRRIRIFRTPGEVRQAGQPECGRHRQLVGQLGELGDLAVAV